jgi:multiple sugar transport system substrate-binding protein
MNKLLKIVVCTLLLATLAFSVWAAGEQEAGATGKPQKVTAWIKKTFNPQANDLIQARIEEYGAKNNLDLTVEVIPTNTMVQKFNTAVEAGTLPDVNFLTAAMTTSFSEKDLLLPLNDLLKEIEAANGDLVEKTWRSVTMGGNTYAIPQWTGGEAIYYRKDLYAEAGLAGPPETWEELAAQAKKLTNASAGIYGAGFAFGPGGDCYNHGSHIIYSYGGSILKKDGKTSNFDTPETIRALKVWMDMLEDGSMPPSVVNWDDGGNNKGYISGQTAIVLNSGSIINALVKPENKEMLDNTGIYLIPAGPKGRIIKHTGNFMAIFKDSKAPDIGKEIIKHVMSYDWYRDWMASIAPVSMPVYERSRQESVWADDPINKYFLEMAQMQQAFGYPGEPTGAHGEIQNLRIMSKTLQRVAVDKVSLEQAVAETDQFIQDHLKQMYGQ